MVKICERCGTKLGFLDLNPDNSEELFSYKVLCNKCRKEIYEGKERKEKEKKREENEKQLEGLKEILFISSNLLEGDEIERYFDLITSEVVLGAGIFSEFEGAFSDFLGTRGSSFEFKLKEGKNMAVHQLKLKAKELGANTIISGKIDYEIFGQYNMIMLVASGTPVILKKDR